MIFFSDEKRKNRLKSIFALRKIERGLFRCSEIDSGDNNRYPTVNNDEFERMYSEFIADTSESKVYAFYREVQLRAGYVDVYIWDVMAYPQSYYRFVISEGFCMPQQEEERFLEYLYSGRIHMSAKDLKNLQKDINLSYPKWHFY